MNKTLIGFAPSIAITVIGVVAAAILSGPPAIVLTLILIAIEICFSFDNAVVNAKVLGNLSPFWQKMFLTVGILIAIVGMRVFFPLVIVAVSAHLSLGDVLQLALHEPKLYGEKLDAVHPSISAFGGAFLSLLALEFFVADRSIHWFDRLERPLSRYGRWWVPYPVTALLLTILAVLPFNHHGHETLQAGLVGLLTYGAITAVTTLSNKLVGGGPSQGKKLTGIAAFSSFLYLEILDASFSFDGVIGAFAITSEIIIIAIGLGVGAIWVRSLTIYMVRQRVLDAFIYLEHGAHYAIAALAAALLLGIIIEIPDIVTGIAGIGVIGASIVASRQARAA